MPLLQKRLPVVCLFFLTALVGRSSTLLTFEGLSNGSPVGNFYSGSSGGNLGISFNSRFFALISSAAGGTGAFAGEPSPVTVAMITPSSSSSAVINIPAGFDTSFSLYYSGPGNSVFVYSGLNAGGNQITGISLAPTSSSDVFRQFTLNFSGTARSVLFGFVGFGAQQTLLDNLQFGSSAPEPSTVLLFGAGSVAIIWLQRRRRIR